MKIRRAIEADAPNVFSCCVAAFRDYIPLIGRTPGPMLEDYYEAIKNDYLFVVPDEDDISGFVLIKEGNGDFMWLDALAAYQHQRSKGVGKALIHYTEDFIRGQGKSECRLYTHVKYERTISIYKHLGYEIYDRVQEYGFDRYYFKKSL